MREGVCVKNYASVDKSIKKCACKKVRKSEKKVYP